MGKLSLTSQAPKNLKIKILKLEIIMITIIIIIIIIIIKKKYVVDKTSNWVHNVSAINTI